MELEPMYFTILKKGGNAVVKDYDTTEVFDRAEKLFTEGELARAKGLYLMVAREAADSATSSLAWFNIALCEIGLEKPGAALDALAEALPHAPDDATRLELRLVELEALSMAGEWEQVAAKGAGVLKEQLNSEWRAKVSLFLARAALVGERFDEAEAHAGAAVETVLSSVALKKQYGDRTLAAAYFRLGQVFRRLFDKIQFRLPLARMAIDISDKLALMRQAEEHFLSSVRVRNAQWSPRAGFEVAMLYETFGLDLMRAEVPTDLDELELQVYTEELNKKILPLWHKAQNVYRNNISMCKTYRFASSWERRSRQRIADLDVLIESISRSEPSPTEEKSP